MSGSTDRLTNLFGALVLGVADRVQDAAGRDFPLGRETTAALVVIGHSPGLSIDRLSRILRLSHPGTVRLVDRLAAAGFAERSIASPDRRMVALNLTKAGEKQRTTLLRRRSEALDGVLQILSPEDRAALERVADTMLRTLPTDATSALTVCRLCNERRCTSCPMDAFGAIGARVDTVAGE